MYYSLHHSKGTLIFSAEDRNQVVEWSKRQLGQNAGFVSIIDSDRNPVGDLVERSGTGLKAEPLKGCRPLMSITADMDQGLHVQHEEKREFLGSIIERQNSVREPIWH